MSTASPGSPRAPSAVVDRRPAGQRRARARAGARVLGRGRRRRAVPGAVPDRLLDRGPAAAGRRARRRRGRARRRVVEGSRDLLPVLVVGAPLRHRNRIYNCAVVIHRGRVLGVAPKSYLPTYREFYERRQFAPGDDQRGGDDPRRRRRGAVRPRPAVRGRGRARGSSLHVEVCEDMWVPIPPSAEAALAGATVLLNLSGSPITVGRAEDRQLLCRSQSLRCLAAYALRRGRPGRVDHRPVLGRPDDDLRERRAARRDRALPRRRRAARWPTSTSTGCARSGCGRGPSTTTGAPTPARAGAFRTRRLRRSTRPTGDIGLRRTVDRFPFVPDDPERLALDCYEAYNIQVSGLEQRLAAIGEPEGRHRRLAAASTPRTR